jgi:hypothetical protein
MGGLLKIVWNRTSKMLALGAFKGHVTLNMNHAMNI